MSETIGTYPSVDAAVATCCAKTSGAIANLPVGNVTATVADRAAAEDVTVADPAAWANGTGRQLAASLQVHRTPATVTVIGFAAVADAVRALRSVVSRHRTTPPQGAVYGAVCVIVLPVDAVVVASDVIVLRASSNAPAGMAGAVGDDAAVPHVTPAAGADVPSPFSPLDG